MVKLSVYRGSMFFLNIIIHYVTGWWFGTFGLFFPSYWGHVIPTDFHSIIFRGVGQLPTRSLCHYVWQCTSNQMLRFLVTPPSSCLRKPTNYTHMLHLWYIYLHGAYGIELLQFCPPESAAVHSTYDFHRPVGSRSIYGLVSRQSFDVNLNQGMFDVCTDL